MVRVEVEVVVSTGRRDDAKAREPVALVFSSTAHYFLDESVCDFELVVGDGVLCSSIFCISPLCSAGL